VKAAVTWSMAWSRTDLHSLQTSPRSWRAGFPTWRTWPEPASHRAGRTPHDAGLLYC